MSGWRRGMEVNTTTVQSGWQGTRVHPHTQTYTCTHAWNLKVGKTTRIKSHSQTHTQGACVWEQIYSWWHASRSSGSSMVVAVAVSGCPVRWAVSALTHISSPRQFQSAAPVTQRATLTADRRHRRSASADRSPCCRLSPTNGQSWPNQYCSVPLAHSWRQIHRGAKQCVSRVERCTAFEWN